MNSADARATFEALFAHRESLLTRRNDLCLETQARFDAELESLFRARFGKRRKFTRALGFQKLPEEAKAFFARHGAQMHAQAIALGVDASSLRFLDLQLRITAAKAELHLSSGRQTLATISQLSFSSQGWGARKYAENAAQSDLLDARHQGVEGEVVAVEKSLPAAESGGQAYNWTEFEVRVGVESGIDCEILRRRPGAPLRDIVKYLWQHGTNPRVYYPFLPYEFEAAVGLDHFGNEVKQAA